MASILFLGSLLLTGIRTTQTGCPHCNLPRKIIGLKLDHDANAERAEVAKKRYELARVRRSNKSEQKRQRISKACGKQSSCCSDRRQVEGNRNEGNEEAFSSNQAAIAVTGGEEIEPKTEKDTECQTTEFDYMFQTSRRK